MNNRSLAVIAGLINGISPIGKDRREEIYNYTNLQFVKGLVDQTICEPKGLFSMWPKDCPDFLPVKHQNLGGKFKIL